jgi:regulatory protein
MGRITAIRSGRNQKRQVSLFLDGSFAFSLETEVALRENLQVGQELSDSQIETLARSDCFHRCLDAAARYLGYRPRSEAELRERLCRRGFDSDSVEAVLERLKEQALVDDVAFAQFWRDSRQSFHPCSRWLSRVELRQKGVAEDIIGQVVAAVDDEDSAYRAAMAKLRSLPRTDYQSFRRRLGEYLRRRGFSYGVINDTVRRMWHEHGNNDK